MLISMTEKNHCYENSLAERGNGILKDEYMPDSCFSDFKQAKQACYQAVNMYNICRFCQNLIIHFPH
jgi:hypothetical protein